MEVEVLVPHGFCAGVRGALERVRRLLGETAPGTPLYCLHEIVHNELVVAGLRVRGVIFTEDLASVPAGATLLISAHGVAPSVRRAAAARGLRLADATCPFVARVQASARAFAERGLAVVVLGHAAHAETRGLVGAVEDAGGACAVLDVPPSEAALAALARRGFARIGVVSQTTMNADDVAASVALLRTRFDVAASAAPCRATLDRQDAVRAFGGDALLVLGSASSSNTRRLCEVARCRAFRAGTLDEVKALDLAGVRRLGVTGGASTPEDFFEDAVAYLRTVDCGIM